MGWEPEWIDEARSLRPMSYRNISKELGVSHQEVYYWINKEIRVKEKKCKGCTVLFNAPVGELSRGRGKYCSHRCYLSNTTSPVKNNPSVWRKISQAKRKPGSKKKYKLGYRRGEYAMRRKFNLRTKGEDCCRVCGSNYRLHLHHTIPRSMYRAGKTDLNNGLPLCIHCHMGWHGRTQIICRDVFTTEEWHYLTSVELTGQNIMPWLSERYPPKTKKEEIPLSARWLCRCSVCDWRGYRVVDHSERPELLSKKPCPQCSGVVMIIGEPRATDPK